MSANLLFLALGLLAGALVVFVLWTRDRQQLVTDAARLQSERDGALRSAEEQKTAARDSQSQLREAFASLAGEALRDNRQDFLLNADALLKPMRETPAVMPSRWPSPFLPRSTVACSGFSVPVGSFAMRCL